MIDLKLVAYSKLGTRFSSSRTPRMSVSKLGTSFPSSRTSRVSMLT